MTESRLAEIDAMVADIVTRPPADAGRSVSDGVSHAGPPIGGGGRELFPRCKTLNDLHRAPDRGVSRTQADLSGLICPQCPQCRYQGWGHAHLLLMRHPHGRRVTPVTTC